MLVAASVRGDERDRVAARSACAESYRADSPEDQRCGPTCVRAMVETEGAPEETCLPVRHRWPQCILARSRLSVNATCCVH
eukprot:COSAG02_NODE_18153_length_957_cov_1.378788_2_plen_80_part_01